MNEYLAACFCKFHMLEKQKLTKAKEPDKPSHVGLWSKKRQLKKESIIFHRTFYISK